MATPLSPDKFIAILKAEGVRVAEYPGWRTRDRDAATGKAFGPVHLIVNHHTAGSNSLDVVAKNGVPGLPAPLAHSHLDKTGLATMCSAGRANHAGTMASNAYTSFLNEKTAHPSPSKSTGTVDGNDVSYGIEVENLGNGKDTYTRAQYDAWVRWNAALCRHYGWSAESVAGHLETSLEGKIDPRGPVEGYGTRGRFTFSMAQFRKDVAERLKHPAGWSPATTPPPEEDDMPLTDADATKVADAVFKKLAAGGGVLEDADLDRIWKRDIIPAARPPYHNADYYKDDGKTANNTTWTATYTQQAQVEGIRETLARVKGLEGRVGSVQLSDAQVSQVAAALAADAGLAERIAEQVAAKLADRLAQ